MELLTIWTNRKIKSLMTIFFGDARVIDPGRMWTEVTSLLIIMMIFVVHILDENWINVFVAEIKDSDFERF